MRKFVIIYILSMKLVEKKIKGKKKIIVQESCQLFVVLYLYLVAFEHVLIAKESLKKEGSL